jgi:ATP-dependent DNA helicase RecQ
MSPAQMVLQEPFGLENFLPKQEDAINRVLNGKSVVVVFPTGGGKRLCYQVCTTKLRGICSH